MILAFFFHKYNFSLRQKASPAPSTWLVYHYFSTLFSRLFFKKQKITRTFPKECNFQLRQKMIKIPYPLVGVSGEECEGEKKLVEKEEFVHSHARTDGISKVEQEVLVHLDWKLQFFILWENWRQCLDWTRHLAMSRLFNDLWDAKWPQASTCYRQEKKEYVSHTFVRVCKEYLKSWAKYFIKRFWEEKFIAKRTKLL